MANIDTVVSKMRQQADRLRAIAEHTSDHRVWRSCRDLADLLDETSRFATCGSIADVTPQALSALCL